MRFETSGELLRLDLDPVAELVPAMRDEWAGLRFDERGRLVNPVTGDALDAVALVDGRHRQVGATYRITVTSPTLDLPPDRRTAFEREARRLGRRNTSAEQWREHAARRRDALVPVGSKQARYFATIREDNGHKLAVTVSHERRRWTVEADVEHLVGLPKVALRGHVDLTGWLKDEGMPRLLAAILGGKAHATVTVGPEALERGGALLEAEGSANRFGGEARLDSRTSMTAWHLSGNSTIRTRGLGRLVLRLAGRRVRDRIEQSVADFWASSDATMRSVQEELLSLRAATDVEGGPAPFARRLLWDRNFDPGLGLRR